MDQGRFPVGKGQEAVGLRVFLAGVASTVFFAALAAALLTLLEAVALASDFFADLVAVDVSVIETSLLDDFVVFLPAVVAFLAAFFAAAAFFTAEVELVPAAAEVLAAFLAADFNADLADVFPAAFLAAFFATVSFVTLVAAAVFALLAAFAALAATGAAFFAAAFFADDFFSAAGFATAASVVLEEVFFAALLADLDAEADLVDFLAAFFTALAAFTVSAAGSGAGLATCAS